MLVLRPMQQDEYPAYCAYFIEDYSQEIVQNYGYSTDKAVHLAKHDLKRCFPQGLESRDHSLLCIDVSADGHTHWVGYLWHSINREENATFIYDFFISNEFRGQGYGTEALAALEAQLLAQDIKQIKLRVAYHNHRALKLYQEVGFAITGYNMSKTISN